MQRAPGSATPDVAAQSALTRSTTKASWLYTGCSDQSVPSLSKTAMRSGVGTKSGEPSFVTRSTNATIAFRGPVSRQDGRGSSATAAPATSASTAQASLRFFAVMRDPAVLLALFRDITA